MGRSNYPNGFSSGVYIRNYYYPDAFPGKVFYVGNNDTALVGERGASDGNDGSYNRPFATLDYAISKCEANRGDVIFVRPNHVETISAADAIDFDVAGISIIGMGNGDDRPRFDYTAGAGEVAIGADNVLIQNINFHANVDSVLIAIDIEDGVNQAVIRSCSFDVETAGTDEFDNAIRFTNNNANCIVEDCDMDMGIADAVRAIYLDADTQGLIIRNNRIRGDYSTACIGGDTTLSTDLLIEDNLLINGEAGDIGTVECIELLTGTHGVIRNNHLVCNVASPDLAIVADTCFQFNNYYSETVNAEAVRVNDPALIDSANNAIGVDDSNNAFSSTSVASNRDGSVLERLEHLNAGNVLGQTFTVQKSLTSSAITTCGVDVTGAASGGDILIEEIILETDGTGLATGTNFTIEKDGGTGTLTFLSNAITGLDEGNESVFMSSAGVVSTLDVVLDSGQKLVAKCTGSSCTGCGVIDITIKARRLSDSATVAAA